MDNKTKQSAVSNPLEHVVMRPIANWKELATVEENENYRLEIQDYCGWIKSKNDDDDTSIYLSTHTFYGKTHEYSTKLLQQHGFNVVLANWDV
jgi:hypothetical protein